ncbi:MAG: DUF2268 domain-containing putative Zn-dependent protease, partial [Candidatus Wallbacteria bacterium]|nr:DUF2268 domain-containing putative Zn-dependent protease [Candidatus Wallbacteria bacterium]
FTPSAGSVTITINPANPNLFRDFDTEFLATLGHELHHSLRFDGPGYGSTLRAALVSEGLACRFETELRTGAGPFYATALSKDQLDEMYKLAQPELDSQTYNHFDWFFGSYARKIPRFAGYSLGFSLVEAHMKKTGLSASGLWNSGAEQFFQNE